jgi:hypothetical protein
VGEHEVREVVGGEGGLEAIRGHLAPVDDEARVVEQHIQPRVLALEVLRELADGGQRGEVREHQVQLRVGDGTADLRERGLPAARVPSREDHRGTLAREFPCGLQPDARGGTRDEVDLFSQVSRRHSLWLSEVPEMECPL